MCYQGRQGPLGERTYSGALFWSWRMGYFSISRSKQPVTAVTQKSSPAGGPSNLLWVLLASAFARVPAIPQTEWGEGVPLPWMHVRALSVQTDRLAVLDHGPFQGQRLRVGSGHVERALTPHPLSPLSRPAVPRTSASSTRRIRRWSLRECPPLVADPRLLPLCLDQTALSTLCSVPPASPGRPRPH